MRVCLASFLMPALACAVLLSGCKTESVVAVGTTKAEAAEPLSASQKTQISTIKATAPGSRDRGAATAGNNIAASHRDRSTTEPTVLVHGKITTADGSPAAGVSVGLHGMASRQYPTFTFNPSEAIVATSSDPEGMYEVQAPTVRGMHLQITGDMPPMQVVLEHQDLFSGNVPKPGLKRIRKDINLLQGHGITGTVVNERDEPMAGLPVHLKPKFEQDDQRLFRTAETTSSASGEFDFGNIAEGNWMIGTNHPDYAALTETITIPTTGPVTLRLGARGGTVSGHVYHKDTGAAASGISVSLNPNTLWVLDKLDKHESKTGADGAFKFDHVSSGSRRILLTPGGDVKLGLALPLPPPIEVNEQETTDVTLFVYPGHTITGRVFDKDTDDPLPGATVSIIGRPANMSPSAVSDASGLFRVDGVFPAHGTQVRLDVELEGYKPEGANVFNSSNAAIQLTNDSTEANKDVPMVKTIMVRGVVVTRDEVPVSHAEVAAYDNRNYNHNAKKTSVNADGTFELEVMPFVKLIVEAEAGGFGPVISEQLDITTKDVDGLKLVMDVGAVVQGRVLGPGGEPVEGAIVNQSKQYNLFSTMREVARSGAKGEYFARDLPKQVTLQGKKDGFAVSELLEFNLKPGETRSGADILLREGHVISGKVVDGNGQAVASASLNAQGSPNIYEHKNSDKDGRFEFTELIEGTYQLHASGNGANKTLQGIRTGTTDVEIVLDKSTENTDVVRYVGTVIDDLTDDPIRDFTVDVSSNLEVRKLAEPGQFELSGVRRRYGYNVTISSPGYMKQKFDTESSQTGEDIRQTFRLGKGGIITGRVVERGTGNPMADIVVVNWGTIQYHERDRIGPHNHTATDQDGKFVLAPAPSGKNTLHIKPAAPLSEVSKTAEVKSEQITDVGDIEIGTGGTIKGLVVRGASEDPVPSQSVSISAWTQEMQISKKTLTDQEGRFEFTGLPAMDYTVQAESTNKRVELAAEATAQVKLKIGGVTIKGMVTRGGTPVRASVSANGPDGQRVSAYAQAGEYEIKNVQPGSYNFSVHPQDGNYNNPVTETVEVPDQAEVVKDFQLPDGKVIVTVVNSAGEVVEGADVSLSQKSSNTGFDQRWLTRTMGNQRSDAGGDVEFSGLGAGTYSVSGRKDGVGTGIKPDVQLTEGQPAQVQLKLSSEGGTLVSVALSYATGQGVQEAWCYLHSESGPFTHAAKRDASGVMVIENIPPGTYMTNVSYWSHSQSEKQVEIKANETVNIEDVLYPAGALHWTLKKADGSPAAGAIVTVTPVTTDPPEEIRNGAAGDNGLFVQRGLAGGTYQVTAQLPGKTAVTETFIVAAGANEQKETTVPGW